MKINKICFAVMAFASVMLISCDKKERPVLGSFPQDADPRFPLFPGGPLKFFAAYDGTSDNPLMNAVDSIRANFAASNPLGITDGISGKGLQGTGTDAIKYPTANDFKNSTSCAISLWVNNTVNPNTELYFSLTDKDYWHNSSAFLLVEHAAIDKCTFKFALMDHWVEYTNQSFTKPLFDGNWHHLVFSYDETNSKLSIYFDGSEVATPGTSGTFTTSTGAPEGALDLVSSANLIVGGWNKQAGVDGPTDDWIKGFSGKMDQFRLYGKALSATEVLALYNSRQ